MFIGTSNTAKDFNRIAHVNRGIAPPGHRTSDKGLYGLKSQCNPGHLEKKNYTRPEDPKYLKSSV